MAYRIEFTPAAERQLRHLHPQAKKRILPRIKSLAAEPRPSGCKKLEGPEGYYRIAVGDYRIIYEIHGEKLVVAVIKIGNRKDVYRRL